MATVTLAAGTDNAQEHTSTGQVQTPSSTTAVVYVDPDDGSAPRKYIGLRFALPVPNGATINTCFIRVTLIDSDKNDADGHWYCEQVDDAASFVAGSANFNVSSRIGGSAVEWAQADLGSSGQTADTPNLASIAQTIVNRAGYVQGNEVAFIFDQDNSNVDLQVAAHGNTSFAAAVLHITWQQNVATNLLQPTTIHQPAVTTGSVNITPNFLQPTQIHQPSVTQPSGQQYIETFPGSGDLAHSSADLDWINVVNGTGWDQVSGEGVCQQTNAAEICVANHAADTDDNYAQFTINTISRAGGTVQVAAICRMPVPSAGTATTADGYLVQVAYNNSAQGTAAVRHMVDNSRTTLSETNITFSGPETWKVEADGTTITIYRNGVQFDQVTDSTITTGKYGGLYGFNTTSVGNTIEVDDWEFGDIGGAPAAQNINANFLQPTQIFQPAVTVGSVNVEANFIQPTQLYEPALQYQITPNVVQPTTIFEPAIEPGAVNIAALAVTPTTIFQPAIQTGAVNIETELLSQTVIYEPSITTSVDIETNLLQVTTFYEPSITVGAVNIAPQLVQQTTIHNPAVTPGAVNIEVEFVEPTIIFEPSVEQASTDQDVEPNFLEVTVLYEPGVQYQILIADVLSPTAIHEPAVQVGAVSINAHTLTPTIIFEPSVTAGAVSIETDLLSPTIIYEPGVQYQIHVDVLNPTQLYNPAVAPGTVNVTPDVVQPTVLFNPAVETGEATIATQLLSQTVIYTPASVFIGIAAPFLQVTQIFTPSEVLSSGGQGAIVLVFDDTPIGF